MKYHKKPPRSTAILEALADVLAVEAVRTQDEEMIAFCQKVLDGEPLTPPEVARLLGVSRDTVSNWIKRGLQAKMQRHGRSKKHRRYTIQQANLHAWLSSPASWGGIGRWPTQLRDLLNADELDGLETLADYAKKSHYHTRSMRYRAKVGKVRSVKLGRRTFIEIE